MKEMLENYQVQVYHDLPKKNANLSTQIKTNFMKFEQKLMLAYEDTTDMFKEFVAIFTDSQESEEKENSLLRLAVAIGCVNIVRLLISKNVNPNIKDQNGNTLLHLAAKHGYVEIVELLLPLVDSPDVQNQDLNTPIALAVMNNKVEIVKLLVSKNVDLNIPDQNGLIPYHYAVSQDLHPISEILEPYRVKSDQTFTNEQPIRPKSNSADTSFRPNSPA